MDGTRFVRRVFAFGAIGVVAAVAPAAPSAGRLAYRPWAATAIPQTTLKGAGKGFRVSALSSDGRVAVVADPRAALVFRATSSGSWGSVVRPSANLRLPQSALANLTAVAASSDGTTVLVAAGSVAKSRAAVYVFHVPSPRAWRSSVNPMAKLTNAAAPAGFGSGVALSSDGSTALVGQLQGADVFHVPAAGSWRSSSRPTATLVADAVDAQAGGLGIAVALSADGATALIGATNLSTLVGAAYIFRAAAPDTWTSKAAPDAVLTDGAVGLFGDGFGAAVALSPEGTTALVGAPNLAFGPAGAAYLFRVRSPRAWASTTDPDAVVAQRGGGRSGEVPGWSVALSAEGTALLGEPSVLRAVGAAEVLRDTELGVTSGAKLTDAASSPGDLFGESVALSADGTTALVSSVRATVIYSRPSGRRAAQCYVPYVHGDAVRAAKRVIASTHCRVGKVTRVSPRRSSRVISQTPEPGERLARGTTIDLRVG